MKFVVDKRFFDKVDNALMSSIAFSLKFRVFKLFKFFAEDIRIQLNLKRQR